MAPNINLKIEDDLEIALKASKKAGDIIMKYYKHDYEINEKGYHNPVTTADKEADSFLKNTLLDARPEYGWLSEETLDTEERLEKNRVWVVDPLDGTKEFIEGVPHFSVSIGLVENGEPVIGVIYNPATEEMFSCEKGKGVYLNGEKVSVSNKKNLINSTIAVSRSELKRGEWEPFKKQFKSIKPIGSVAYLSLIHI